MKVPPLSLNISHPDLASQWHPHLNGDRNPGNVSSGSDFKATWICVTAGHNFESAVSNRVRGRGCPFCAGKAVLAGFNDLATTHPDLASQWNSDLNPEISPQDVNAGSHKRIFWVCAESRHTWQATIASRAKGGNGCPFCAGQVVESGVTDLESTHPELALQWHSTLNGDLNPTEIKAGSNRSVYWTCPTCAHDWQASPATRLRSGCPVCAGKTVQVGFNDLATTHPELAAQWHPTRNGDRTPETVTRGSDYRANWICDSGSHVWTAAISNRSLKGYGCPVCSNNQVLKGFNDLATTHPELAAQWHQTLNGKLKPEDVVAGSDVKPFWACNKCGHTWSSRLAGRAKKGAGCPACAGQVVVRGFNDLATTHPELAAQWHPTMNGTLNPENVSSGSHRKVVWICLEHKHVFQSSLSHRKRGQGCPFCSGKKVLEGFNDLATTHPELAAQWHPNLNSPLNPKTVTAGSNKSVTWVCSDHGHQWVAQVCTRSAGRGCPVCAGQVTLEGFNDLATTHPELAAQWHPELNGNKSPMTVSGGSGLRIWWTCTEFGHQFRSQIHARTYMGSGCPTCAHYGFDASKPAILYFITNSQLAARKVGITNVGKRRLAGFSRSGWEFVFIEERDTGHIVRDVETALLIWLRKELRLPQHLGPEDMGGAGGWTETFSEEGPSNSEVINRIKTEFAKY